jgi:multiple sugar transport system ATP-binding protein
MGQLVLSNLKKSFGDLDIIKGVNLDVTEGEFVVFVGPSGCGKSTLLRMIAGLEDVTSGEMMIGGKSVNDLPPVKRGIAMVFQSTRSIRT